MRKIYLLGLLLVSGIMDAQTVNIPDAAFKAKLVAANPGNITAFNAANQAMRIDANFDGEIQVSEALLVRKLEVNSSSISDMTGIEAFTNLTQLFCLNNSITTLNVSMISNLSLLNCNNNQIATLGLPDSLSVLSLTNNNVASLNVLGMSGLTQLHCNGNQLTSLNVSGLTNLAVLQCQSMPTLLSLDATGCSSLNEIATTGDTSLNSLLITGCISLNYLSCSNSQLTTLDASNLPALLQLRCENNLLTSLNISGTNSLTTIYCQNNQLASLDVSSHPDLINLLANNNLLTSLDVSDHVNLSAFTVNNNPMLTTLDVSGCTSLISLTPSGVGQLATLNVSGCTSMQQLQCTSAQLVTLNASGLANLNNLSCQNNALASLNLTGCTNLQYLSAFNNDLTSVDFTGLNNLTDIDVSENSLTALDVVHLVNLVSLNCSANALTILDLSSNINLNQLNCSVNNLGTLFIKNGKNESSVNFGLNPSLAFICADEMQVATIQNQITLQGSSTVCNSYCSFTPGGNYNTITGNIRFDGNNNGCDAGDVPQDLMKLRISDGTNEYAAFTNASGNYTYYVGAGSYTVTPDHENPTFYNVSPLNSTVNFPDDNNNIAVRDFCVATNGVHPDVEVVIAPVIPAKPGFVAVYQIVYKNKGNQTLSGSVSLSFNDAVMDYFGATVTPNSQTAGSLIWNYTNLSPFENREIYILMDINAPTDTPAVNIDDVLTFTADITPVTGDETVSDNQFILNQLVVGSFDPNNVICVEGEIVAPTEIGNYLHYIINFENTGTAEAENIVVRTEVNPLDFDINSLQLLNASHAVDARIRGNTVEFIFPNILLESGGHGNVLLKVKSRSNLQQGDSVSKRANIYFDYNFPIETNDAETVFQSLSNPDFEIDSSVSIYPNPSGGIVNIKGNNTIKSIQLFDVQGRLLQSGLVNDTTAVLDISSHSNGIYFVKAITDKGIKVEKLVKR